MSYLQLKNLTASYDKEIVLNNLSLDIKKRGIAFLTGIQRLWKNNDITDRFWLFKTNKWIRGSG